MQKNKYFFIFLILLLGLLLRISGIEKPEGLWNDEYMGWYIASEKNLEIFFQNIIRNCHTPFYYLYLKFWISLFGDADIALRYSSVIPSILSIPVMYFAGKESKDEFTGYLTAFFCAISSFSIYFAQEVRLYSLVFLFSSLAVLFAVKLIKQYNKKDLILYFISSALVIFTHTLGIMYSFLLTTITLYYVISKFDEAERKKIIYNTTVYIILPITAVCILISPFLINIVTYKSLSQFWANFSFVKVYMTFADYFSPLQLNMINTFDNLNEYIFRGGKFNRTFFTFGLLPTFIAFLSILISYIKRNKKIECLFITTVIFFIYMILISKTERMILLTKYTTEMYPALIIMLCYGLTSIKKKVFSFFLITIFLLIHLTYLLTSADAAFKLTRPEGNYAPVALIRYSGLKQNDYILFSYYDENKFFKYFNDAEKYHIYSINKFNFNEYLYNNNDYIDVIKNGKHKYKETFKELPNKNIVNYVQSEFIRNMKIGDKIAIISLKSVSNYTAKDIIDIVNDNKKYKKTPFIFLVFSDIRVSLNSAFINEKYKIANMAEAGLWNIIVYEKIQD